jgi:hypothetical protein
MKSLKTLALATAALLAIGAGTEAAAQGFFGISLGGHDRGRHGRHGSFGVSVAFPICGAPAHVHGAHCRQWIPGHFEERCEQVYVPGCTRQVWMPPVYETRYTPCGTPIQVLVRAGYHQTIQEPGRYETIRRRVWVEGRWVIACGH